MLIELFGRNFGSFRDEFHLSMLATDIDPGSQRGVVEVPVKDEDEPLRLLRSVAIYGPNASGKTRLLLAAHALAFLIESSAKLSSDETLAPYAPFLLDDQNANAPVQLGLRAVIDHCVYEYTIEFTQREFVREILTELTSDGPRILFDRHGQEHVTGQWTEAKQFALLLESFRPNALLLSLADGLAPGLTGELAVRIRRLLGYRNFSLLWPFGSQQVAKRAYEDIGGFQHWLLRWIKDADVGIVDCKAERVAASSEPSVEEEETAARHPHSTEFRLAFVHAGLQRSVGFDYLRESLGTVKMVELAPYIYDLTHGNETRAFFVDEIGASLHPVLLQTLIRQFNCETPPDRVRGQLIFATHETLVLDDEAKSAPLRRDQIYLTEKDASGASRLYSIAEFKERNNLNLRRRYLQGRYGALPALDRFGV